MAYRLSIALFAVITGLLPHFSEAFPGRKWMNERFQVVSQEIKEVGPITRLQTELRLLREALDDDSPVGKALHNLDVAALKSVEMQAKQLVVFDEMIKRHRPDGASGVKEKHPIAPDELAALHRLAMIDKVLYHVANAIIGSRFFKQPGSSKYLWVGLGLPPELAADLDQRVVAADDLRLQTEEAVREHLLGSQPPFSLMGYVNPISYQLKRVRAAHEATLEAYRLFTRALIDSETGTPAAKEVVTEPSSLQTVQLTPESAQELLGGTRPESSDTIIQALFAGIKSYLRTSYIVHYKQGREKADSMCQLFAKTTKEKLDF